VVVEAGVKDDKTMRQKLNLTNGRLTYKISNWSTNCEVDDCANEPIRCINNLGRREHRNLNMKCRTWIDKVSFICATVASAKFCCKNESILKGNEQVPVKTYRIKVSDYNKLQLFILIQFNSV
jgi:hypothetical protein